MQIVERYRTLSERTAHEPGKLVRLRVADPLQLVPHFPLHIRNVTEEHGGAVHFRNECQLMPDENFFDGIGVFFCQPADNEIRIVGTLVPLVIHDELGNDFVGAAVVQDDDLREVENRDTERSDLANLTLDAHAQGLPGGTRHEMRVEARYRARHERRQIEGDWYDDVST